MFLSLLIFQDLSLELKTMLFISDHQPFSVSHSPAPTDGKEPRTVTNSRCPRTFTRSTANPLSSLKKVTRSTSPAISSDGLRACWEESFILIEVYAGKTELGQYQSKNGPTRTSWPAADGLFHMDILAKKNQEHQPYIPKALGIDGILLDGRYRCVLTRLKDFGAQRRYLFSGGFGHGMVQIRQLLDLSL